jgi:hypothetical protein
MTTLSSISDQAASELVHVGAGCSTITLKNVVPALQVTHERLDRGVAFGHVVVVAGKTQSARRPVSPVHALRISEDDRDVEVSALVQRFEMVIDYLEQSILVNNFARHGGVQKVSRGIVA